MQKYKMILVVLVIGVMPLLILKNPQGQPLLIAADFSPSLIMTPLRNTFDALIRLKNNLWDGLQSRIPNATAPSMPAGKNTAWIGSAHDTLPAIDATNPSAVQRFYRWTDAQGVPHIASQPSTLFVSREVYIANDSNILAAAKQSQVVVDKAPNLTNKAKTPSSKADLTQPSLGDVDEIMQQVESLKDTLEARSRHIDTL